MYLCNELSLGNRKDGQSLTVHSSLGVLALLISCSVLPLPNLYQVIWVRRWGSQPKRTVSVLSWVSSSEMPHIPTHPGWKESCITSTLASGQPDPSPCALPPVVPRPAEAGGRHRPHPSLSPWRPRKGGELKGYFATLGKSFLFCNPPLTNTQLWTQVK